MARELAAGMGRAVAERTVLRKFKDDGELLTLDEANTGVPFRWENWEELSQRVALGNSLLCKSVEEQLDEYALLHKHIGNATILLSGRHLQHGDKDQPTRPYEVWVNCATAPSTFLLFYLLLNGSGVGRCYDDDMVVVNWDYAPNLRCVLSENHPDFDYSAHESVRDAKHKYGSGKNVLWHKVGDTREGWAKALEIWELAAFQQVHANKMLILDFSDVRAKGTPIKGMQNRPASGPVPLMNAFQKAATLKGSGIDPWLQAMYCDHYFAECVLVGGARRAARMSTKWWRDRSVLEFITIKRPIEYQGKNPQEIAEIRQNSQTPPEGFLWSSNDSVMGDDDFWSLLDLKRTDDEFSSDDAKHARKVFKLLTEAAYCDGTGEPGLMNGHLFVKNNDGWDALKGGDFAGNSRYQVEEESQAMLSKLARRAKRKRQGYITNPCVTEDTWVDTSKGRKQVKDLIGKPFVALVDGKEYPSNGFFNTGRKQVFEVKTSRGYSFKATAEHPVWTTEGKFVKVSDLNKSHSIVITNNREVTNDLDGDEFHRGWVLGEIVGDGGHNPEKYPTYMRFWGDEATNLGDIAGDIVKDLFDVDGRFQGGHRTKAGIHSISSVRLSEFASKYLEVSTKELLPSLELENKGFIAGFLRGVFDADGTVLPNKEKGVSVRISQTSANKLKTIQRMLLDFGIASTVYFNRNKAGMRSMPDGRGGLNDYHCKATHELVISRDSVYRFRDIIGFYTPHKQRSLEDVTENRTRGLYSDRFFTKVVSVEACGEEQVYDCTVEEIHKFVANGCIVSNCSEIVLSVLGGYCVIGDVVPFHANTLDEAEEAFRSTTRALMRVNLMEPLYGKEVKRTNRIGVSMTGIHEFAWKFFGYGFRDLIDEEKSQDFWATIQRFGNAVKDEARKYANLLGQTIPHTALTIKPAGTTSKLWGLTEGWHLPSMREYLRWVQFRNDDPLVAEYAAQGYPVKHLRTYEGTTIVGFPTAPLITTMGMGDKLVTAAEATPEEQYRWIQLGEKYWIRGEGEDLGNQISYTLKYDPTKVSLQDFRKMFKKYQKTIRCCSVMPQEDVASYEYQPEQPLTKAEYEAITRKIKQTVSEDIGREHLDCDGGACPVDFRERK